MWRGCSIVNSQRHVVLVSMGYYIQQTRFINFKTVKPKSDFSVEYFFSQSDLTKKLKYLDNNVSLAGACPVEFSVFFYHDDFSFLLHSLCVLLNLIQNAAVVLLGNTHKLHTHTQIIMLTGVFCINILCSICLTNKAWTGLFY